jgi:toxin ParE1/3/4
VKPDSPDESRPQVEIIWSRGALRRLTEIRQYIAADKPAAAGRLAARIVSVVSALRLQPNLGRAGSESGVRELVIGGTPYIVIYRVSRRRVTILTIWHGAQRKDRSSLP